MNPTFPEIFSKGTNGTEPYDYQILLACGDSDGTAGTPLISRLIGIPTGLGKTAAIIFAWLWNRLFQPDEAARAKWPRRLVIILPMRSLVEQTEQCARRWISSLKEKGLLKIDIGVHVLMGGTESGEWDIYPEKEAILIGTQDMVLSRALNRGYGLPRARWPMHFGLLHNDCLLVLDEIQLIGVGVRTSAQLEGLRQLLGTAAPCATWWASATLDERLLRTPDHQVIPERLALAKADFENPEVIRRTAAVKRLSLLPFSLEADTSKAKPPYIAQLAAKVAELHKADTNTIVILNRVDRAKELCSALAKIAGKQSLPIPLLIHSRFRPMEREALSAQLTTPGEKIIVATQAIEAGIDISSRTLITELAPWSSLIQRFGRCNRKGEFNDNGGADIYWINLDSSDPKTAESLSLPYTPAQLTHARTLLHQTTAAGASPEALQKIESVEPLPEAHILRRKDLVNLFETTPDLSGLDIDVGRYIRDDEDRDALVFWRKISKDTAPAPDTTPLRRELVRVPIREFFKFAEKNKASIWHWNVLEGAWQSLRFARISPGQTYLIDYDLGGYSEKLGWTGEKAKDPFAVLAVEDQPLRTTPRDGQSNDEESLIPKKDHNDNPWQDIETHTAHVADALRNLLTKLPTAAPWEASLLSAVYWHDVGKAHPVFQECILAGRTPTGFEGKFVAKAPRSPSRAKLARPSFRHELASALAWLQAGNCNDPVARNLVAYLIATHHGKVRLSIRSMPDEKAPDTDGASPLYARGVWHGDLLPGDSTKTLSTDGFPPTPITLDLTCMQMGTQAGQPSWTTMALTLRDSSELGIFRLAWLETLLRAADANGSKQ